MKTLSWSAGIALLAVALCAPRADAQISKCQRTIAKAGSQAVQAKIKALSKCEEGKAKGSIPSCPDQKATDAVNKANAKLSDAIAKSCGGDDKVCGGVTTNEFTPAALGWPSRCPDFERGVCDNEIGSSCNDITTCMQCIGDAAANQAVDLYYDALAPSGGNKALLKCQTTIGKAASAFLVSKTKALQKCWDARLNGKHSNSCVPPAVGDGKYLAAITKAEDKKIAAICKACGGADKACGGGDDFTVAQIGFASDCFDLTVPTPGGANCGGPITTLQDIVDCVDCVTEFKADCTDQLQVPQFVSPYPTECSDGCILPAPTGPCPTSLSFTADGQRVDLDTGFTGLAHNAKVPTNGRLTLTISGCAGVNNPTCGQCNVNGPIDNTGGIAFENHRCQDQPWVTCDNDGDCITAGATGPCIYFFGSPLPLVAGAVSTCVLNEVSGPVTGTIDLGDGSSTTNVPLSSKVHPTGTVDAPCPNCVAGTCVGGPRDTFSCSTQGSSQFGDVTLDCPPNPGANAGTLGIDLIISTGTQSVTVSAANPTCRQTGYTGLRCLCDTCNNANAESCSTNADCPDNPPATPGICGGRRCLSGSNVGAACTAGSECPGSSCSRPGQATQPNVCVDDSSTPEDGSICTSIGGNEGICVDFPVDLVCSIDSYRGCMDASECNPPGCPNCTPGQTCEVAKRKCFTDNGVIGNSVFVAGSPSAPCGGVSEPEVGTFFCVAPVSAPAVNAAGGLPALGRVRIPGLVVIDP